MASKICSKCGETKELAEFSNKQSACKKCRNEIKRQRNATTTCFHCEVDKPKSEIVKHEKVCKECLDLFKKTYTKENRTKKDASGGVQSVDFDLYFTFEQNSIMNNFLNTYMKNNKGEPPEYLQEVSHLYKSDAI